MQLMEMEHKDDSENTQNESVILKFFYGRFFRRYWPLLLFIFFLLLMVVIARFFGFGDRFTMAPPEPLAWKEIGRYLPIFAIFSGIGTLVVYVFSKISNK